VHDGIVARAGTSTLTVVRTVFRGARWPGDVAVRDGRIEAVGSVAEEPEDETIRCDGDLITAGLVQHHHHLYQWMTRGRCVGCDLFGWLVELYPVWGRLDVEDVRAAALVGLAELALTGCTTAADHHYLVPRGDDTVFDAIVDAARPWGSACTSREVDGPGRVRGRPPARPRRRGPRRDPGSTESVIARHHDGERVVVTVAPCSPFSVTPELMRESAALARRHGLRLHTHLAETVTRNATCSNVSADARWICSTSSGGSTTTCGWRTGSTSTTPRWHGSAERGRGWRTARPATHASAPGCAGSSISRPPGRPSVWVSMESRPTR
jgi:cytosine/adenosine deaminase-related metal-dependent hydrolase